MALIKTEALVVKTSDYSESTRLVTLFSPGHGRIRVLAKGIRRIKSRDRGLLEPFARAEVTVFLRSPDALGTLKESALISSPATLRRDYDRWLLASLVLEVIDRATLPGEDLGELYQCVCAYLDDLETTDRPAEATAAALVDMLGWFGFQPQFEQCCACGGDGPFAGFRIDRCSVVCRRCAGGSPHFRPLPPGTIKVLQYLAGAETVRNLARLRASPAQIKQVLSLLVALLQYHLDVSLTTARMLASLPAAVGSANSAPKARPS